MRFRFNRVSAICVAGALALGTILTSRCSVELPPDLKESVDKMANQRPCKDSANKDTLMCANKNDVFNAMSGSNRENAGNPEPSERDGQQSDQSAEPVLPKWCKGATTTSSEEKFPMKQVSAEAGETGIITQSIENIGVVCAEGKTLNIVQNSTFSEPLDQTAVGLTMRAFSGTNHAFMIKSVTPSLISLVDFYGSNTTLLPSQVIQNKIDIDGSQYSVEIIYAGAIEENGVAKHQFSVQVSTTHYENSGGKVRQREVKNTPVAVIIPNSSEAKIELTAGLFLNIGATVNESDDMVSVRLLYTGNPVLLLDGGTTCPHQSINATCSGSKEDTQKVTLTKSSNGAITGVELRSASYFSE